MEASHVYPGPLLLTVFTSLCRLWNLLQSWNLSLLTCTLKDNSNQIWQPRKHPQDDQEGQSRDTREEPCWSVVPWLLCSRFHLPVLQIETQIIQGLSIDNLIEIYSQINQNWWELWQNCLASLAFNFLKHPQFGRSCSWAMYEWLTPFAIDRSCGIWASELPPLFFKDLRSPLAKTNDFPLQPVKVSKVIAFWDQWAEKSTPTFH